MINSKGENQCPKCNCLHDYMVCPNCGLVENKNMSEDERLEAKHEREWDSAWCSCHKNPPCNYCVEGINLDDEIKCHHCGNYHEDKICPFCKTAVLEVDENKHHCTEYRPIRLGPHAGHLECIECFRVFKHEEDSRDLGTDEFFNGPDHLITGEGRSFPRGENYIYFTRKIPVFIMVRRTNKFNINKHWW
jgi:hypothetical protein